MAYDSLRRAARRWKQLGGTVEPIRRTGEHRYRHPLIEKPITVNARRHDATRFLMVQLRRIERGLRE